MALWFESAARSINFPTRIGQVTRHEKYVVTLLQHLIPSAGTYHVPVMISSLNSGFIPNSAGIVWQFIIINALRKTWKRGWTTRGVAYVANSLATEMVYHITVKGRAAQISHRNEHRFKMMQ